MGRTPQEVPKLTTATATRRTGRTRNISAAPPKRSAAPRQLRPLGDRVVIQPTPREDTTKSGIVIPDTVKERPQEGLVLAVGPGRILDDGKREPIGVNKGDKVLYAKYGGTEVEVDDVDLLIVSQKDILAVVES
jgi:chaperonin GroES